MSLTFHSLRAFSNYYSYTIKIYIKKSVYNTQAGYNTIKLFKVNTILIKQGNIFVQLLFNLRYIYVYIEKI